MLTILYIKTLITPQFEKPQNGHLKHVCQDLPNFSLGIIWEKILETYLDTRYKYRCYQMSIKHLDLQEGPRTDRFKDIFNPDPKGEEFEFHVFELDQNENHVYLLFYSLPI